MLESQLNTLIPPEIKYDEFYDLIQRIAQEKHIKTILEIGSSSGSGSTEAFVQGIETRPDPPTLFCIEVSRVRFAELQKTYQTKPFIKCYNASSIAISEFLGHQEVREFYALNQGNPNLYPLDSVLSWLEQDLEYARLSGVPDRGIQIIKQENNIDNFDVVLLDGSGFAAEAEFKYIYGAEFILLDDINVIKNYNNYYLLLEDTQYELIAENKNYRNGYAIFKKRKTSQHIKTTEIGFINGKEQAEKILARNLISSKNVVFDVGAHVGDYSVLLSENVGYFGKVYVFEPTTTTFQKLKQRLNHYHNITATQKAVYSTNTTLEINEFPDEYSSWNSLGKPIMADPSGQSNIVPIVNTEKVETITLDSFCEAEQIEKIDFLKVDVEGAESEVLKGATNLLNGKKIQYLQFEISQKMLEGLNKEAEEVFSILMDHDYESYQIAQNGEIGALVTNSNSFYENYIAFPSLPIHFFTIVLNGEPFIHYHIEVLKELPFRWHWHIIEGVADLKHDTAWTLKFGGKITDELHDRGLSKDGTSDYIDELARQYPNNITVYRKPNGQFWDGKREMVNAPLDNIQEECLLWQIDVDEFWTSEQIDTLRKLFITNPKKTAAFYWCWFFVGENLVVSTRNCYSQNPQQEWLRTWRFQPGYRWISHSPPILGKPLPDQTWQDVAKIDPFFHEETEQKGLVFQHFAYTIPKQLQFKEQYYGYRNALNEWKKLEVEKQFPVLLREYFPWVSDDTLVEKADTLGIDPILQSTSDQNSWQFIKPITTQPLALKELKSPRILIDGVFFQYYSTGIARVWKSLLEEWVKTGFSDRVLVLDRGGSAPKIPGIRYRTIPPHNYRNLDSDRAMLQEVCDLEKADVFISTYYSFPRETPSVLLLHDMIPEVFGANLQEPMWKEKQEAIQYASSYLAVSQNTAQDFQKFYPEREDITIAPNGVSSIFTPASEQEIAGFKYKYGISKPYFLLVAPGTGYKNSQLFFQAFAQLCSKQGFELVCTGNKGLLDAELRNLAPGIVIHTLLLSDEELRLAYCGAVALAYPSLYEGFGMPIVEALACACPVITGSLGPMQEIAENAALYVDPQDIAGMIEALCEVQKPKVRQHLIEQGLTRAKAFSWTKMANIVSSILIKTTLNFLNLREINVIAFPNWTQSEDDLLLTLQDCLKQVATHPDCDRITLLIYRETISEEDAELVVSGAIMNLLLGEGLEISEDLCINFVDKLDPIQWEILLPQLSGKIKLIQENQEAIINVGGESLPVWN